MCLFPRHGYQGVWGKLTAAPGGLRLAVPSRRALRDLRALLAACQALRTAVTDAVQSAPGTDPDRASYQIAVETAQNLVTTAANITDPVGDLAGDIGRAVLASLHGPRRPRIFARRSSPRSAAGTSTPTANPAQTTA